MSACPLQGELIGDFIQFLGFQPVQHGECEPHTLTVIDRQPDVVGSRET